MNGLWWATLAWVNAVALGYRIGAGGSFWCGFLNLTGSLVCMVCLYKWLHE